MYTELIFTSKASSILLQKRFCICTGSDRCRRGVLFERNCILDEEGNSLILVMDGPLKMGKYKYGREDAQDSYNKALYSRNLHKLSPYP